MERRQLSALGMSEGNINRMYRCLYVYTVGIHEAIAELSAHALRPHEINKRLWKAYLCLIEGCSRRRFDKLFKERRWSWLNKVVSAGYGNGMDMLVLMILAVEDDSRARLQEVIDKNYTHNVRINLFTAR